MPRCDHCLLEFPERDAVLDERDGRQKVFCCNGCCGIYRIIHTEGLDSFYARRKWDEPGIPLSLLKKEIDVKPFSELVRDAENGKEIDIYIDGIRCASCVWLNEKILSRTEGVDYARVNYATHRARIRWNPEKIGLDRILKRILSIGYNPKPFSESEQFRIRRAETRDLLIRFGTAGFLSSQLMLYSVALYAGYFQGIDPATKKILEIVAMLLTFPVIFYSGMPFIRSTISGLRHFRFTMDALIVIGAGSAFLYSIYGIMAGGEVYFDTAAMIITLILLGRYIEAGAKGKASETIERLVELAPKEATKVAGSVESHVNAPRERVAVSSLKKGDLIEVKPGERIPLDGTVVSGRSEADESILTGESKPALKASGSGVIGGSMNLYGTLLFEVTRTGKDTVLSGIIRAVEDAQARKPKIQALADRVVGVFVPVILGIALLTVIFYLLKGLPVQKALMTGISTLVIACPCSLGLATPLAVLIFTNLASRKGILIKGGEVIENTGRLSHVIFDKTGTITSGKPSLRETVVLDTGYDREYIISIAASVERLSEHSIGHAVISGAGSRTPFFPVDDFLAEPGKGVAGTADGRRVIIGNRALMAENRLEFPGPARQQPIENEVKAFEEQGDTVIYIGWDGLVRAFTVISDMVRDEALPVVTELKNMKHVVMMVSGDNPRTTMAVASGVGIEKAESGVSPVGKKEVVTRLQEKGSRAMMIGDGINDAPALTAATVGVAMGRGTDIAMESSDAVLVRNDLRLVPSFIRLSRRAYGIIKQNIFWAFFYNIFAIPLAVAGVLHPIVAAFAMTASSLFVVGNSLRIRKGGG